MDNKAEVRDFLITRRARITPEQAGLPAWGGHRRVAGLRREEVALLAGVSADYYTRLERGNLAGVSEQVLDALSDALRLDEAERTYLAELARAASRPAGRAGRPRARIVRPSVHWLLDQMDSTPAYVRNARTDLLAASPLGRALYAPLFADARPNVLRFLFLNTDAGEFFIDRDAVAAQAVATLRMASGENPHDRSIAQLVGELSTRSDEFGRLWAAHDVRQHRTGTKRFHHPVVGDLTLSYESMALVADPGLVLNAYAAEPGSPSAEALDLLACWAAKLPETPNSAGQLI